MTRNSAYLNIYMDKIVTEMVLSNDGMSKTAQLSDVMSGITDSLKNYFGSKVDPNDRAGSVINMLAPGVLAATFKALGFTKLGLLFGLAMSFFDIDVKGILTTIWEKLKSLLGGGRKVTPQEVSTMVQDSVQAHSKPATAEEAAKAEQVVQQKSSSLRDARIVKMAILEAEKVGFEKVAQRRRVTPSSASDFFSLFSNKKAETSGTLTRVLSWIFIVILFSAGLMVGADAIKHYLGMDNAFDGTGKPAGQSSVTGPSSQTADPAPATHVATQTKFKLQPGLNDPPRNTGQDIWVESVANDKPSIESMVLSFAKQVYQGLNGLDNVIRSTPGFQVISERIEDFNHSSAGNAMVAIPPYLKTKKQIVDLFIDDVAQKAP